MPTSTAKRTVYTVITNANGHHAIWRSDARVPPGWNAGKIRASKAKALAAIQKLPRPQRPTAKYSRHIDYLIASIFYLGTQDYWWARTPLMMAQELALNEAKLELVFEAFPGIFRRSLSPDKENGQLMYSLQARYAGKDHKTQPDTQYSRIEPLSTDKIRLLQEFVLKSAEDERAGRRAIFGYSIGVTAAVITASAALYAAVLKQEQASRPDIINGATNALVAEAAK
jgi:uncharacterized protein YbdZ (MbtH family)